jgi:alkanesulfonate monooxygenase SsuD/methylene tetrahydromethanopterin reductase-like flavin-dependent oxidoreductase (luciferase family)
MKLGLCIPQMGPHVTTEAIRHFATQADVLGYSSLWAQEHLFYPLKPIDKVSAGDGLWPAPYRQLMAPMELLSYVGAITSRVDVGTSILVSGYHRPIALAKQAATIDVLTGGRFILGLGLGWSRAEYAMMETPFEKRGERSQDFLNALRACLGPNPVEYDGPIFQIPISETSPKPFGRDRDGRPALRLCGGFWSEAGMRRTAEFCDYWTAAPHTYEQAIAAQAHVNQIARDEFSRGPLKLIYKVMACPKLQGVTSLDATPVGMPMKYWSGTAEDMLPELFEAKAIGIDEVVIDVNYFEGLRDPDNWAGIPDFFAPLLRAAQADRS